MFIFCLGIPEPPIKISVQLHTFFILYNRLIRGWWANKKKLKFMSKSFTLFQRGELTKSVYTRQIVAIVLLLLLVLLGLLDPIIHRAIMSNTVLSYYGYFAEFLKVVSWVLLFTIAINKTSKIATGLIAVEPIVRVLIYAIASSAMNPEIKGVWPICQVISNAGSTIVYWSGLILLLKNTIIKSTDRSLFVMLIVISIFGLANLASNMYSLYMLTTLPNHIHTRLLGLSGNFLYYIFQIFYCIAIVKLVKCGVFDGKSDEESGNTTNYPIAKYIVGIVIPTALMSLLAYLIITNSSEINSMF